MPAAPLLEAIPVRTLAAAHAVGARRSPRSGCFAGFACGLLALVFTGCGEPEPRPPNLLLVTVDSLRADFLACYGGDRTVGVRICELGAEGARYAWAFSPSSRSAPAVASILTSTYPSTHRLAASAASFLQDEATTLAEELRRAGYARAAFVASPELNRSRNLQQGFDVYDDHTTPSATGGLPRRSAQETTDAAIAWVRGTERPFFLWIHYREPHGPYDSPARPDDASGSNQPGERLRVLATATGRGGIPGYQAIPGIFTRQSYEGRYRAEIRSVDAQLARLLLEIEQPGERLGILVTADHGEAFGEDRWYLSHGHSLGLDQIRVPLVWRPPGGRREPTRTPVSTLDVAPTLLRAAGLRIPEAFEGWALPGPDDPPGAPEQARALFAEHDDYIAVVTGDSFYTRLREPQPLGDGAGITSEALRAVSARTATLGSGDGALPRPERARPVGVAPVVELLIADFLARAESRDEPDPSEADADLGGAGSEPEPSPGAAAPGAEVPSAATPNAAEPAPAPEDAG
jgi:arylsulfatase